MRVWRGYQAAREAILHRTSLEEASPPEAVSQRLRELFGVEISPQEAVARILAAVRETGDAALLDYTRRIDGPALTSLEVSPGEIRRAYEELSPEVRTALELAASRIRAFHQAHLPTTWVDFSSGLGQITRALDRVGLYVPGGRAAYPSTVLMTAIPASVAGVPEVVVATPPDRAGNANPLVLAAAKIAGIGRVFKMGGAQAIAAMAYGTASVPRVDKICGLGTSSLSWLSEQYSAP